MEGINTQVLNYFRTTGITDSGSTNAISSGSGKENEVSNDSLGKDAFLRLLVTELRYQDPLSPMDNKEFIAQMAQFSSLEQMQNMNNNMENFLRIESLSQGAALIGKKVETIDPETGETLSSRVKKVAFEGGKVYAYLENELKIEVNDITAVS